VNINRWAIIPLFLAASLVIALATRSEAGTKTKNFEYIATGGFEPTLFIFPDGNQGDSITLEGTSHVRAYNGSRVGDRFECANDLSTVYGPRWGSWEPKRFCQLS
jgi:hypothetical protein